MHKAEGLSNRMRMGGRAEDRYKQARATTWTSRTGDGSGPAALSLLSSPRPAPRHPYSGPRTSEFLRPAASQPTVATATLWNFQFSANVRVATEAQGPWSDIMAEEL